MPEPITKLAYQTFHQSKSLFSLAHKFAANAVLKQFGSNGDERDETDVSDRDETAPKITPELLNDIRKRLDTLVQVDWQDAEAGVYPSGLLFENLLEDFVRHYPRLWWDMPKTWQRANEKNFRDFPASVDTSLYPNYYTQNFHYQTDGYLSEESANLYDLQVELLFNGGADPMRRRVLAPLKKGLQAFAALPPQQIQILDAACGTGRTLKMLRGTFPEASLHGVDLSPAYLGKAQQLIAADRPLVQLAQGNVESLPYRDNYFHGVTCVFLFHELPGPVRQNVINECFRVTQPGGTFVICDSIQLSDSPHLGAIMDGFATTFHEPFYRDYTRDSLVDRLTNAGFDQVTHEVHFMSKYLIAHKPAAI
jgi:ubiquinone/menaquinone biosynthesis C-methylase UbiE